MPATGLWRSFLALLCLCLLPAAFAVEDITFLHLSDVHYPHAAAQSRQAITALPAGEIDLQPFSLRVPAAAFAIITGDLNEYGGGNGDWEGYMAMFEALPFPRYLQLGNHDNTWDCGRPRLRRLHGSAFYAFEQAGLKFIGFDTASPQDPRPSIAREGLLWLGEELAKTPPQQPIVFFCHHPLQGTEFASAYDIARLLDLLSTRNVALILLGHGHGARAWQTGGIDTVMGGSTYGDTRGFGIVSIKDNVLRVCHQFCGDTPEMVTLLEKPLAQAPPAVQVVSVTPGDGAVLSAGRLRWEMEVSGGREITAGRCFVGKEPAGEMTREGAVWVARLPAAGPAPGAHTLRMELVAGEQVVASQTVAFWLDDGSGRALWKARLDGSCQSPPAAAGDRLYVGANDGNLYCLQAATGQVLWTFATGGEVRSRPAVDPAAGRVWFASADGCIYCLNTDGAELWRQDTGAAVYSSPLRVGDRLLCANNAGDVLSLDPATGAEQWRNEDPGYSIESDLCSDGEKVYAGCWDRFVYAIDLEAGSLVWKVPGKGSEKEGGASRYYSPADCGPVVVGDSLFVTDRGYWLAVLDTATGQQRMAEGKSAAVCASADGRFAYVRHSDGRVSKRGSDGAAVWTAEVPTGSVPTPPVASEGRVWMLSSLGTLSCIDEATGQVQWQYKAFPDLYAFGAPAVDEERAYMGDMGGNLVALSVAQRSPGDAR